MLTGNNVSHAHNKSRRRFLPNLQKMSLMSEALGKTVRLRLTPHALRSVDRSGGLDAFLMKAGDEQLSLGARRIKRRIQKLLADAG